MIGLIPEYSPLQLDDTAMPCRMAVQQICRAAEPRHHDWAEFLVRPAHPWDHLQPLEFVECGYKRRGLDFDLDIIEACLESASSLARESWFSINIHPSSLHRERFVDSVRTGLKRHGIKPARVILELVEFGGPVNLMASKPAIEELRGDGVRFALDDFGPGFSNLEMLGSDLIDFVKIDRSVVRFVDSQPGYRRLLSGLQALAEHAGVALVAEGVENETQARLVAETGVEWIQGFLYSRPEPVANLRLPDSER